MTTRLLVVATLLTACKDSPPATSGGTRGSAAGPPAVTAHVDAGTPDALPYGTLSDEAQAALTAYVVKLRELPATIRATKKPVKTCSASDVAAAGPKAAANVLPLVDLDALAGNKASDRVDPTYFMRHMVSPALSYITQIDDAEHGKRAFPQVFMPTETIASPLLVVIQISKIVPPQVDTSRSYWPGAFKGVVYVVDVGAGRVLCGAPLAFATGKTIKISTTGLEGAGGKVTWLDAENPGEALVKDFAKRGHAALQAAVAKMAPDVTLGPLRD